MATRGFGIDIGGSGIKGRPVDLSAGTFAGERVRTPTPTPSTPSAVAGVVTTIVQRLRRGVGRGGHRGHFPAVIQHGVARTAANVDKTWIGTDVEALLREHLGRRDGGQRRRRRRLRRGEVRGRPRRAGHRVHGDARYRHRQRPHRRRPPRAEHRARPPGGGRQGRRDPCGRQRPRAGRAHLGTLGARLTATSRPSSGCSGPTSSSWVEASARRPTSSCRCCRSDAVVPAGLL